MPKKPATLLKRDSGTGFFLVNFAKFLRTPFLTEHWLLLSYTKLENFQVNFRDSSLKG